MFRKVVFVGAVALLAAGPAASAGADATATLTNSSAGAGRVGLTVVLQAVELQCGRLNARSLTIALPHVMRVPRTIPPSAVRVSGSPVTSVRTSGSTIDLGLSYPKHVATCDSITLGVVRLQVGRAARLGNPPRAGTYGFTVQAEPHGVWRGSLVVR